MIPVARPDEPDDFDETVRQRGRAWMAKGGQGRPPSYWRAVEPELREAFEIRCGYTAMLEPSGTVDHFVAVDRNPALLYEWSNYRYASAWINSSKKNAEDILDPYEVGDGWFELILPSMQLRATERVPDDKRALVEHTLRRLPLVDDERVLRQRREWLHVYEEGHIDLEGLRRFAPLVAAAVEKRDAVSKAAGKKKAGTRKAGSKTGKTKKPAQRKTRPQGAQ